MFSIVPARSHIHTHTHTDTMSLFMPGIVRDDFVNGPLLQHQRITNLVISRNFLMQNMGRGIPPTLRLPPRTMWYALGLKCEFIWYLENGFLPVCYMPWASAQGDDDEEDDEDDERRKLRPMDRKFVEEAEQWHRKCCIEKDNDPENHEQKVMALYGKLIKIVQEEKTLTNELKSEILEEVKKVFGIGIYFESVMKILDTNDPPKRVVVRVGQCLKSISRCCETQSSCVQNSEEKNKKTKSKTST